MAHETETRHNAVRITGDPLKSLPVGASLPLTPVVFGRSSATVVPDDVGDWGFFDGALLAVGLGDATRLEMHGNAVMVAPGLAVTAAHVVDEFAEDLGRGTVGCLCIGVRSGGSLDAWKLRSLTYNDGGDLAWLSLELCSAVGEDWHFSTIAMTTRAPKVGEKLTIVGFRFETQNTTTKARNVLPKLAGRLLVAAGKVQAVYPHQRDKVMVPFPAIEMACGSLGAMSGGAVLDAHGLLTGVVSTGFNTDSGDGPSYAAWIISALDTKVDVPWPPGVYKQGVSVLDLPPSACCIIGRDAMVHVEGGGRGYRVWFDRA